MRGVPVEPKRRRHFVLPPHSTLASDNGLTEYLQTQIFHPSQGGIALQVHGGGDYTKEFVRYRNIRVKELTAK